MAVNLGNPWQWVSFKSALKGRGLSAVRATKLICGFSRREGAVKLNHYEFPLHRLRSRLESPRL
jgi:hypothetical protein